MRPVAGVKKFKPRFSSWMLESMLAKNHGQAKEILHDSREAIEQAKDLVKYSQFLKEKSQHQRRKTA